MTDNLGDNSRLALCRFAERIERLNEEKQVIASDTKEVYAEAKADGFDPATLRRVIALRKMDQEERKRREQIIEVYETALDEAEMQESGA